MWSLGRTQLLQIIGSIARITYCHLEGPLTLREQQGQPVSNKMYQTKGLSMGVLVGVPFSVRLGSVPIWDFPGNFTISRAVASVI